MKLFSCVLLAAALPAVESVGAEAKVIVDHLDNSNASRAFEFKRVPPPARNDAAAEAEIAVIKGERDPNGGNITALKDGRLPLDEDEPRSNFFFMAGSEGGKIRMDLGKPIDIKQVNSYSWHPGSRGPQVYKLYGRNSPSDSSNPNDLNGWNLIATVDTTKGGAEPGGQYAVSIQSSEGTLGKFQYLHFDISPTAEGDRFAQTFFSEIDVIDAAAPEPERIQTSSGEPEILQVDAGGADIRIDLTESPELKEWAEEKLVPVVKEWYPRIVKMLPSEGYEAPQRVNIQFLAGMDGVANASGTRIRCAARWFRNNLDGEAVGAVVHELVHVVQQYGRGRRNNPEATRTPGWIVEGIPDYIRWFLYEPETKGAEITRRNVERARYDSNYRITANFINWVVENHDEDKNLIRKLNAAAREGRYSDSIWTETTGKTIEELGEEWRKVNQNRLASGE